jgi:hypothetical protein
MIECELGEVFTSPETQISLLGHRVANSNMCVCVCVCPYTYIHTYVYTQPHKYTKNY